MEQIQAEKQPVGWNAEELMAVLDEALAKAEVVVRAVDPATLTDPRAVGRKRLPTTVIGLLTHIAEHMQRHVGQAISAAKWSRVIGMENQNSGEQNRMKAWCVLKDAFF
jgi:uncharacterized damage-inducible protein DinB